MTDFSALDEYCKQHDILLSVGLTEVSFSRILDKVLYTVPINFFSSLSTEEAISYVKNMFVKRVSIERVEVEYEVRLHPFCQGCPYFEQGNSRKLLGECVDYELFDGKGQFVTHLGSGYHKIFSCVNYDICERAAKEGAKKDD